MEREFHLGPMDDRDEDDPEYEIDPKLSSPDFDFSAEDPAITPPRIGTPAEKVTFDPQRTA